MVLQVMINYVSAIVMVDFVVDPLFIQTFIGTQMTMLRIRTIFSNKQAFQ